MIASDFSFGKRSSPLYTALQDSQRSKANAKINKCDQYSLSRQVMETFCLKIMCRIIQSCIQSRIKYFKLQKYQKDLFVFDFQIFLYFCITSHLTEQGNDSEFTDHFLCNRTIPPISRKVNTYNRNHIEIALDRKSVV